MVEWFAAGWLPAHKYKQMVFRCRMHAFRRQRISTHLPIVVLQLPQEVAPELLQPRHLAVQALHLCTSRTETPYTDDLLVQAHCNRSNHLLRRPGN